MVKDFTMEVWSMDRDSSYAMDGNHFKLINISGVSSNADELKNKRQEDLIQFRDFMKGKVKIDHSLSVSISEDWRLFLDSFDLLPASVDKLLQHPLLLAPSDRLVLFHKIHLLAEQNVKQYKHSILRLGYRNWPELILRSNRHQGEMEIVGECLTKFKSDPGHLNDNEYNLLKFMRGVAEHYLQTYAFKTRVTGKLKH